MSVQFSPDGSKIVSGGASGTIKVWDAGELLGGSQLPWLPSDGLLVCFPGTLELTASKESAHSRLIHSVAFSPDGMTIVSGSGDKTIKVWDIESLTLVEQRNSEMALSSIASEIADHDGARCASRGRAFYTRVHWLLWRCAGRG